MSWLRKIGWGVAAIVVVGLLALSVVLSHNSPCPAAPAGNPTQPMKAAVNRCYGAADAVVRIENLERPVPSDHGVLIRVYASSVNPLDWHFMLGEPYLMRLNSGLGLPKDPLLGTDFAGTVVAVGKLVTRFKPGDQVYGGGDGAFAQYLLSPDDGSLAVMPTNMPFDAAAAAPVAGITALQALRDHGQLRPGQKVLINGAGGGVGTFAVQIAKALGATVTAVTNTASIQLVQSLGADHAIDYSHVDFTQGPDRYDLIFDLSGNHSLSDYRRVLTPNGIYVLGGDTDKGAWLGPLKSLGATWIVAKFVKQKLEPFLADINQTDLVVLAGMLQDGKIKPVIDRRYPLAQVAEAIRYQQTGHARGKVVVMIE